MPKKDFDLSKAEFISTGTIATLIDCSTETVRREILAGKLKAFRFNGNYAVRVEDFQDWKQRRFKPIE